MSFSKAIKEGAMLASARHCCVCKRYKGVKMEMHHIKQEADGGSDTFDNAIPLCHDCHSDAGHYNDRHSKGIKFSPYELIKARDRWYADVENGSISEKLEISKDVHTCYFVLNSFSLLDKISKKDYSSFKFYRNDLCLKESDLLNYWRTLTKANRKNQGYLGEQVTFMKMGYFNSIEEYQATYEGAQIIDKAGVDFPYFACQRKITWDSIMNTTDKNTYMELLQRSGLEAHDLFTGLLYENTEGCGDYHPEKRYAEYVLSAPISFIFLGISNISRQHLKFNTVISDKESIDLPNFTIRPNQMILVPIGAGINLKQEWDGNSLFQDDNVVIDYAREFSDSGENSCGIKYFEGMIKPQSVIYNDNEGEYEVQIHQFDHNNMYALTDNLAIGSCPHLFFIREDGKQEYSRELLHQACNVTGTDSFQIPKGIYQIIIRELEDEVTYLDKIYINGKLCFSDLLLKKGESITIEVQPFDTINVEGRYEPENIRMPEMNDLWFRNELIKNANRSYNIHK